MFKIFAFFVTITTALFFINAFAFDESSMPSGQYSRSMQSKSQVPINEKPKIMEGVSISENLGKTLDLNLEFTNQNGEVKNVAQILNGKPLILSLNYYRCSTLCSIQLVNLSKSMSELGWNIGQKFNMATISFDPSDTIVKSKEAHDSYLDMANQPEGQWNFYTGSASSIKALTEQLGYFYKYDPESKEFAHAAAIFFISPSGKISRYLYGINYPPNQIKFSLMDASQNKIGSITDQVLLTCFHYNPTSGKYDVFATNLLKISALITVIIVIFFLIFFIRRDRKKFF